MKILLKLQQFVNNLNRTKTYLMLGNVFLVFFLIVLSNLKVIPLRLGDFIFFAALTLALALYRPGWAFLLFIGTIILENINLAPASFPIAIRPYQFIGALIILAILIRLVTKRLYFKLAKLTWPDWLVIIINLASLFSLINSPDKFLSLKLSLILATFSALYLLARNYVQNIEDLRRIVPFFLVSGVVAVFYGLWQNWQFMDNLTSFEVMPGRPNATFFEADWLGMSLVLIISVIYALVYKIFNSQFLPLREILQSETISNQISNLNPQNTKCEILNTKYLNFIALYVLLVLVFIVLILTVSRSAWLGALAVTFIFLFIILTNLRFQNWQWREFLKQLIIIISAGIISVAGIYVFNLTNFQLFNRVQSAGSGLQKITISCKENKKLPESINSTDELEEINCRHINLEEIENEKASGKFVTEILRTDPNVNVRSQIYQKSWEQIKKHPVLGIGWGSIGVILGHDERGASLNSSNIFLEVWLGSGIVGVLCFSILLIYILLRWIKNYFYAQDCWQKTVSLFMLISWFAIIIPNLFNAGLFLGFLWVWLAMAELSAEGGSASG